MDNLVIIGSGPAGLTAAIYAGRANLNPLIVEGRAPGGQLMGTTLVENWPGEKTIMGPMLMGNMRQHAIACGARFLSDEVIEIEIKETKDTAHPEFIEGSERVQRSFLIKTNRTQLKARAVIIASGAAAKKLGAPGEDTYWGRGVTTCAVCDGALYAGKATVVVGGGDTAMEDALFLSKYTDNITIVHILDKLTASYAMQQPVLANKKIKIMYQHAVEEVRGNGEHAHEIVLIDKTTSKQATIPAEGIFIAIGQVPNTQFLRGKVELNEHGYIQLHETKIGPFSMLTGTSVPGLFAAGDVADPRYRQAITSAASGCMAALDVERYLKLTHS